MAIKDTTSDLPLYEQLNAIHNAASRAKTLTKQLLGFACKQPVVPKIININDAIECTQRMLQQLVGENIDLVWSPKRETCPIKMGPSQISQILANLCINAKDAITNIGKIVIETNNITLDDTYCTTHPGSTPGKYAMLTVSDNGCGMDKDTEDKISEPFFTTKDAIHLAEKHLTDIDLLMTDVIMPEMNGRDLADKISAFVPDIKTLFMSGYTADVIAQHGVLEDGIDFIQKPFLSKPLCKKLREVLDSK